MAKLVNIGLIPLKWMSFDGHDDSAEAEHDEAQWSEEFKSSSEIFPEKII